MLESPSGLCRDSVWSETESTTVQNTTDSEKLNGCPNVEGISALWSFFHRYSSAHQSSRAFYWKSAGAYQMQSFSAAANRTAAAWKICISLCDHTLASETGETPPEEVGIVSFLGSTIGF